MSCRTSIDLMNIRLARGSDAAVVGSVLQEAARWLAEAGQPLWSAAEISPERVQRDTDEGLFHIAWKDDQASNQAIGVIKIELEDVHFWPEIPPGTSVYIHKLAVRRCWANRGVSTALLAHARMHAQQLGRDCLRLDCAADRQKLRSLYEDFGFSLNSVDQIGAQSYARYALPLVSSPGIEGPHTAVAVTDGTGTT